jgi:hypothetical protein
MARKKQTTVLERLESPDCALFTLPGELRNTIYELVFENGNETMSVADFASAPVRFDWNPELPSSRHVEHTSAADVDAVPTNAGPPSSALVRTCQKIRDETEGVFAGAYQCFWQKSFVFDLRGVSLLDRYMDCVPTAWIRTYILVVENGPDTAPSEVVLSHSGGKWQASDDMCERDPQSFLMTKPESVHFEALFAFQRLVNKRMLYVKPKKWRKMSDKPKMKKSANKKFSRKDNKLKTKSKRVQTKAFKAWKNRPKIRTDIHGAPRPTKRMSGPLTIGTLLRVMLPTFNDNLRKQLKRFERTASFAEYYFPYSNDQLFRWMAHKVDV